MYYIEKNEKEVVKYELILHKNGINEVRDRLIKDYSTKIRINNFLCFCAVDDLETDNIKEFVNYGDRIGFNYYIYPELVILIDMLLNGNAYALKEIINYDLTDITYKNLINENNLLKISNNISKELDVNFSSNDLLFYINQSNLKLNNVDYMFLKDELLKCISFKKISTISLNNFYEMMEFLNLDSNDVLNSGTNVVKKRKKCN